MKNILIPTDFSKNSRNAVLYALDFFRNQECNFYILHVTQTALTNEMGVDFTNELAPMLSQGMPLDLELCVDEIKVLKRNKKHHFFPVYEQLFLLDAIREQVIQKKIDYIVMGTKGASGFKEVAVGSNTGDVITKVKCPILVVPENAKFEMISKIAFPTDFNMNFTTTVINTLLEILETQQASLAILNIKKDNAQLTNRQLEHKEYLNAYLEDHTHHFHTLTQPKIEVALQQFINSESINLIAMVAKNLNFFQLLLFTPLVEQMSYHTDIPFLVLHE
ncbi:universal stress protein [Leeuwenhoekiella sp. MAR_2009_132]|uniref:universal stress protein n=1 Tax=Leeuwenhoekiella sp. MAR_2009_132 TaxID=1392489 RepID=UPI00048D01DC|nr:universal stress protein [Leeuwenhoekiella sp. MAR_2009_132]